MSTITPLQLCQAAITTSPATAYTVPGSTTTFLKSFDICNTVPTPVRVRIYLVPSGHSADTGHALLYDFLIAENGLFAWEGEQVLAAASTIQVSASIAGLTITASGVEVSA
jgi:hypothetical protein